MRFADIVSSKAPAVAEGGDIKRFYQKLLHGYRSESDDVQHVKDELAK